MVRILIVHTNVTSTVPATLGIAKSYTQLASCYPPDVIDQSLLSSFCGFYLSDGEDINYRHKCSPRTNLVSQFTWSMLQNLDKVGTFSSCGSLVHHNLLWWPAAMCTTNIQWFGRLLRTEGIE
jgi:hypothetical protein